MLKELEQYIRWDVKPLHLNDTIRNAARRLSQEHFTDLPVVDEEGHIKGIFGEKEVIGSLFPTYLDELKDTTFVISDFEDHSGHVRDVMNKPVEEYMRTEYATLPDDFSAMHCAELFLHRRQGVIPLVREDKPLGLVRRSDLGRVIIEASAKRAPVADATASE